MKCIPGFSKYKITKDGKIWSRQRKHHKFLSGGLDKGGYRIVVLSRNKKHFTKKVHRLVLETFVGPCPKGFCTCHNNNNRSDNRLENLRWDTYSNNQKDRAKHGTSNRGETHYRAKLTKQDVKMIICMWATRESTQKEIAEIYNIHQSLVSYIVNKKRWKHIWSETRD